MDRFYTQTQSICRHMSAEYKETFYNITKDTFCLRNT